MAKTYNLKHYQGQVFEPGEIVVMLRAPAQGQPTKLQSKYREKPLQVIEKLPGDTYRVAEVTTEGQSTYATTARVSQLKSWKVLREEGVTDEPNDSSSEADSVGDIPERERSSKEVPEVRSPVPTRVRTSRVRRAPSYLTDYVTK